MGLFDSKRKKKGNAIDSLLAEDALSEFTDAEKQQQDSRTQAEAALQTAILQFGQMFGGSEENLDDFVPKGEFGYEITNPVMVTNLANSYHYLNRLECVNGDPIEYSRIYSKGSSSLKHPVDVYDIKNKKTGKTLRSIYIYGYGKEMSKRTPTGLRFK